MTLFKLTSSHAEVWAEPKPISEVWLNLGFYSYHFQKDIGLKNVNEGFGVEYRYSTVSSITAGLFKNSDWQTSHYAGWYWQPLMLGPAKLGAVFGMLDGYPKMNEGRVFFAAIPTISMQFKSMGTNILLIPDYQDRLHGSISFQLKFKLF